MKEKIIWSNLDMDEVEFDELDGEVTEHDYWLWLEDERMNLDIATDGNIIAIADLGLWNGRSTGYWILAPNISSIFDTGENFAKWYCDGYNIKAEIHHHDGVNYVEYREIKKGMNIDALLDKIYNGEEYSRAYLNRYTKSIAPQVKEVYGW